MALDSALVQVEGEGKARYSPTHDGNGHATQCTSYFPLASTEIWATCAGSPGGNMLKKAVLPLLAAALLCSFGSAPVEGQRGQPVQLPEGNGKDAVQATCTQCHALNLIANTGYSRAEWQD